MIWGALILQAKYVPIYSWLAMGAIVFTVVFFIYNFGELIGSTPGFRIGGGDAGDFDMLSQYIADHRALYSSEEAARIVGRGDHHGSMLYRGFTLYIGVLKIVFGSLWKLAFVAGNCLLMVAVSALSTRLFFKSWNARPFSVAVVGLACANLWVVNYARFLWTDYGFAFLAMAALTLTAHGTVTRNRKVVAAALVLSALLVFWRSTGVNVFALVTGTVLIAFVAPERYRFRATLAAPVLLGVIGAIAIAVLSTLPKDPEFLPDYSDSSGLSISEVPKNALSLMAKINLFAGEDQAPPDGKYGSWIVVSPYDQIFWHDGDVIDMLLASVKRTPKLFEIWIGQFSLPHNIYRVLYYVPLYSIAVISVVGIVRHPGPNRVALSLTTLLVGYLFVFVALHVVNFRFRLFFDLAAIYLAAHAVQSYALKWRDWAWRLWSAVRPTGAGAAAPGSGGDVLRLDT